VLHGREGRGREERGKEVGKEEGRGEGWEGENINDTLRIER